MERLCNKKITPRLDIVLNGGFSFTQALAMKLSVKSSGCQRNHYFYRANGAFNPLANPDHQYETVHHLLFGSLTAVRLTIQDLHKRRYAGPNDWSKPISTGRPSDGHLDQTGGA